MMSTLEILVKARALIAEPEHWLKGAYFATADGNCCHPMAATRFCALGALCAASDFATGYTPPGPLTALRDVLDVREYPSVSYFNDASATSHEDILDLFDRAIGRIQGAAVV